MTLVSAENADSLKNEPLELDALNLASCDYSLHFVTVCMERNACHVDLLCQLPWEETSSLRSLKLVTVYFPRLSYIHTLY